MNDIIKIVKFLEDVGLLIKDVSEAVKNEVKKQIGGFLDAIATTWVLVN